MKTVLLIGSNGYIGSYLSHELARDKSIQLVTCDGSSSLGNTADFKCKSNDLPLHILREADLVLFFGGCSSVASAVEDPRDAIDKNLLDLINLTNVMGKKQRLIYASSASVYSSLDSFSDEESLITLSDEKSALSPPQNAYDATKQAFDLIAPYLAVKTLGLRLGTLSGMSRNLRSELVFNSMTIAALTKRQINLQNSKASRSILFLDDLYEVLSQIIEDPSRIDTTRLLNVASLNGTFGEIAQRISEHLKASINLLPDSQTYSFAMDTSIMNSNYPVSPKTLEQQVDRFRLEFEGQNP